MLEIYEADCLEGDMTSLFVSHRDTIREISIQTVGILKGGGTWHSLFRSIRDQLQIVKLRIGDYDPDDEYASIQEDDAAPAMIHLEVSGDREALDRLINMIYWSLSWLSHCTKLRLQHGLLEDMT